MTALRESIEGYLDWCITSDRAVTTVEGKRSRLRRFGTWCLARGLHAPSDVQFTDLEAYRVYLFREYESRRGKPLDVTTRYSHLLDIKEYFRWSRRAGLVVTDISADLELPRLPRRLRQTWLEPEEVEQILARAGRHGATWMRDQAMLELLYATGLRRKEFIGLDVGDVDFAKKVIKARNGKGEKERYVPIAERACIAVERYLKWLRPKMANLSSGDALFLNRDGKRFRPGRASRLIQQFIYRAGINKRGAFNLFRHGVAVAMLNNGADIRQVQEMLGHADITTTQVYAHVAIQSLQRVYEKTHPAARPRPSGRATVTAVQ